MIKNFLMSLFLLSSYIQQPSILLSQNQDSKLESKTHDISIDSLNNSIQTAEKAWEWFCKGIIEEKQTSELEEPHTLVYLIIRNGSRLCHKEQKNDEAINEYKKAFVLTKNNKKEKGARAMICYFLAYAYFKKNNHDDYKVGLYYLQKGIELNQQIKHYKGKIMGDILLADILKGAKKYDKALEKYEEISKFIKKHNLDKLEDFLCNKINILCLAGIAECSYKIKK